MYCTCVSDTAFLLCWLRKRSAYRSRSKLNIPLAMADVHANTFQATRLSLNAVEIYIQRYDLPKLDKMGRKLWMKHLHIVGAGH